MVSLLVLLLSTNVIFQSPLNQNLTFKSKCSPLLPLQEADICSFVWDSGNGWWACSALHAENLNQPVLIPEASNNYVQSKLLFRFCCGQQSITKESVIHHWLFFKKQCYCFDRHHFNPNQNLWLPNSADAPSVLLPSAPIQRRVWLFSQVLFIKKRISKKINKRTALFYLKWN